MTQVGQQVVRKSVVVEAPQEHAFRVFTEQFAAWWPLETHHIGKDVAVDAVIEPRAGGRWYEVAADGTECDWGRVAAWEPPSRVLITWMLNPQWAFDEAAATEVEVTFTAEGPATTRVELVHSGFDRIAGGDELRTSVGGDGGWGALLALYAEAASRA